MSDLRHWSRAFFTEFIELYRRFPCLWQVKSKDYSNRDKRHKAYVTLMDKRKEVDREATKDTVAKKISSFRTVYRKDLSKVNNSMRSSAGAEEIYKPSLWYLDLLSFLNDQEQPRLTVANIEDSEKEVSSYYNY
jgi:hypothetical protein